MYLEDLYLVSCAIVLFCTGLVYQQTRHLSYRLIYMQIGNIVLLLTPLTGYLGIRYSTMPDFIIKLSYSGVLLFCAFVYLHYQQRMQSALKIALHCCPYLCFYTVDLLDIDTNRLPFIIVFFGIIFSYSTASWLAFRANSLNHSRQEWLNIIVATLIIVLSGAVVAGYLSKAAWLGYCWHVLNVLICIYVISWTFKNLYRPSNLLITTPLSPETPERKEKLLNKSVAAQLAEKLTELLTVQKVYLDNTLSLAKLSELLGINVHQTSELLNVHMDNSFYQLLNRYRIEHACQLLNSGDRSLSITEVLFSSGFNNKNTFYREFKRCTGMSPSAWQKKHKQKLTEANTH
ncbi:helix-turn-helix domain-containing protein [Pseudoalteromonas sp. T1lg65]|uniref:helix-turn-helix domain-containing protein n=1 Tax=Pseudoalteromonas sp. T1lg65 TaxID=2077101 RepID=UPI003F78FD80